MNNELLPCPFCGSIPEMYWCDMAGGYYIECTKCNCTMTCASGSSWNEEEAAAAWNRRAEPKPKPLTLEELRERTGKPVWLYGRIGKVSFNKYECAVVNHINPDYVFFSDGRQLRIGEYGETWLSYDREVKESE